MGAVRPPTGDGGRSGRAADPSARGQVHTLEGIVAALLLVTSVIFALQMTSVTPLSASTSSQHIENQQQASAAGALANARESGALREAVLFWNATGERFHDTDTSRYYSGARPPNAFGETLEEVFGSRGIAYNVYLVYQAGTGNATQRQRMVYVGEPSDNAVRTSRSVVLTDDAHLVDESGDPTGTRVDADSFYAPDAAGGSVYNVVRVEVVVWRI